MAKRSKKGSWIVDVTCKVNKEVICDDCTEKEAETDPFEHVVQERETDLLDWTVNKVTPNE